MIDISMSRKNSMRKVLNKTKVSVAFVVVIVTSGLSG